MKWIFDNWPAVAGIVAGLGFLGPLGCEPPPRAKRNGLREGKWLMAQSKVHPPRPLQTERLRNGRRELIRNLVVQLGDGRTITVPKGFETDFSSIPRFARFFIHWSRVDIAGVVHDFLYWCPQKGISRTRADAAWREIAGAGDHHANWVQRSLGWVGLRVGGRWAFRKARKERDAGRGRKCKPGPPPSS